MITFAVYNQERRTIYDTKILDNNMHAVVGNNGLGRWPYTVLGTLAGHAAPADDGGTAEQRTAPGRQLQADGPRGRTGRRAEREAQQGLDGHQPHAADHGRAAGGDAAR